jgi:hypothetical protein
MAGSLLDFARVLSTVCRYGVCIAHVLRIRLASERERMRERYLGRIR